MHIVDVMLLLEAENTAPIAIFLRRHQFGQGRARLTLQIDETGWEKNYSANLQLKCEIYDESAKSKVRIYN
jgi:hypothetical protein